MFIDWRRMEFFLAPAERNVSVPLRTIAENIALRCSHACLFDCGNVAPGFLRVLRFSEVSIAPDLVTRVHKARGGYQVNCNYDTTFYFPTRNRRRFRLMQTQTVSARSSRS